MHSRKIIIDRRILTIPERSTSNAGRAKAEERRLNGVYLFLLLAVYLVGVRVVAIARFLLFLAMM